MIDIDTKKLLEGLRQALSTISPRERAVIISRLCGGTLKQAGAGLDPPVGPERARQLEYRGTRKLLHPSRIKHIREALKLVKRTKRKPERASNGAKERSEKLLKEMEPWLRKRMELRLDGRLQIRRSNLPNFADHVDHLPQPVEIDGEQKQWVDIGWIDHGKATGDEPLVIVED
jgi:sulfite reductase beta subunit-like hemoprotein